MAAPLASRAVLSRPPAAARRHTQVIAELEQHKAVLAGAPEPAQGGGSGSGGDGQKAAVKAEGGGAEGGAAAAGAEGAAAAGGGGGVEDMAVG